MLSAIPSIHVMTGDAEKAQWKHIVFSIVAIKAAIAAKVSLGREFSIVSLKFPHNPVTVKHIFFFFLTLFIKTSLWRMGMNHGKSPFQEERISCAVVEYLRMACNYPLI